MSATLEILRLPHTTDCGERDVAEEAFSESNSPVWNPEVFAREQIRGMVRQVFLPGYPKPARQVVFSSIDRATDVAEVCALVSKELSAQKDGNVCLVEASLRDPALYLLVSSSNPEENQRQAKSTPKGPKPIADNLWVLSAKDFLGNNGLSAAHLRVALTEIRRDFEYALIHAPLASLYSEPALLGHLSDGIILVLQANRTRRLAAQKTKQSLQSMNAKLLGTVLNGRSFPIPERLYRLL